MIILEDTKSIFMIITVTVNSTLQDSWTHCLFNHFSCKQKKDDTCLFPFKNAHLNVFHTSKTIIARKIGIVLISQINIIDYKHDVKRYIIVIYTNFFECLCNCIFFRAMILMHLRFSSCKNVAQTHQIMKRDFQR